MESSGSIPFGTGISIDRGINSTVNTGGARSLQLLARQAWMNMDEELDVCADLTVLQSSPASMWGLNEILTAVLAVLTAADHLCGLQSSQTTPNHSHVWGR